MEPKIDWILRVSVGDRSGYLSVDYTTGSAVPRLVSRDLATVVRGTTLELLRYTDAAQGLLRHRYPGAIVQGERRELL